MNFTQLIIINKFKEACIDKDNKKYYDSTALYVEMNALIPEVEVINKRFELYEKICSKLDLTPYNQEKINMLCGELKAEITRDEQVKKILNMPARDEQIIKLISDKKGCLRYFEEL